jgi:hypothetical protein
MKVGVYQIIADHFDTLRDAQSHGRSKIDFVIFYFIPSLLAVLAYLGSVCISISVYNVSITFFGIFVALLLNIQVAVFGIFQRKWDSPGDPKLAALQEATLKLRRQLLSEVNANISYLILVSCIAIVAFLVFFAMEWKSRLPSALSVALYGHFLLTLLMVVKRAHALFQREYKDNY